MDLFQLAADNRLHLEERFTAMKATLAPAEADRLGRFATMVDEFGRISINMRQTTLLSFLTFGSHQHMYEWARSRAAHSSMPADAIMKERMKGFYEHRVFFDTQFDGARGRVVRLGNAGCMIVRPGFLDAPWRQFTDCRPTPPRRWDRTNYRYSPAPHSGRT